MWILSNNIKTQISLINLCVCVLQLSAKPYVVNHLENPPTIPMTSSDKEPVPSQRVTYTTQVEAYTSDSLEHGIVELRGTEDEAAENQCVGSNEMF